MMKNQEEKQTESLGMYSKRRHEPGQVFKHAKQEQEGRGHDFYVF